MSLVRSWQLRKPLNPEILWTCASSKNWIAQASSTAFTNSNEFEAVSRWSRANQLRCLKLRRTLEGQDGHEQMAIVVHCFWNSDSQSLAETRLCLLPSSLLPEQDDQNYSRQ